MQYLSLLDGITKTTLKQYLGLLDGITKHIVLFVTY